MTTPSTSTSSPPLPCLALEVHQHVLRFCDPSTLANTSRVSLAFLELPSPILYQDIEIVGLKNLEKLFCSREPELDYPHLNPHLSLSQVRNLTIIATSEVGGEDLDLSTARLPPLSSSLSVEVLTPRPSELPARFTSWPSILPLLDPRSVRVVGITYGSADIEIPYIDLGAASLPNLVHLYFSSVVSETYIGASLSKSCSPKGPMVMVFDLASIEADNDVLEAIESDMVLELSHENLEEWPEGLDKEFVVRVVEEADRERFEDHLRECWEDDGRLDDFDAFRSRLRFEIASQDSADEKVSQ